MEAQHYPAYVIRRVIRAINDGELDREAWNHGKWLPYYYNQYDD